MQSFGAWPSPISAHELAVGGVRLGQVSVSDGAVYWLEQRPGEGGRNVAVSLTAGGDVVEVAGSDVNVRTLVHEYGGGAYTVDGATVYYSDFADQRLYGLEPGAQPRALTPAPPRPRSLRYADADVSPDGRWLFCVRERHEPDREPVNEIVRVPTDGTAAVTVVASGHDFYACPRVSPDGAQLVFTTWDHPRMPWDGTDLWLAQLVDAEVRLPRHVAGGPDESIFQPSWGPGGRLHFVSDRTGWWNLYRMDGEAEPQALAPMEAEFGAPQWAFRQSTYAFLDDGRIGCIVNSDGVQRLGLVDDGRVAFPDLPFTAFFPPNLHSDGRRLVFVAAAVDRPSAVVRFDPADGGTTVLRRGLDLDIDERFVARPEPIDFPTADGETAHAVYYPPSNPDVTVPADERPPLLVHSHGGPTGQTPMAFNAEHLFWTSRGFAVVDVNYGGSTGYGRSYRKRLQGRWGIVDTIDCVAAARFLAERGDVDPQRLAIRGGSAGGWTTLCALTFHDVFAAGTSYYGVADAARLAADTHKFESRYLDGLIGPWPEAERTYHERSPIHFTDRLSAPMLLLQGLEDEIVPPSQAEQMAAALRQKGLPFAYLAFEGEQHGFRRADTVRRAAEAELSFYGQVFGFTPAGDIPKLDVEQLP